MKEPATFPLQQEQDLNSESFHEQSSEQNRKKEIPSRKEPNQTMKLRLRSKYSTKETISIEISDHCTLHDLKLTILQKLGSSSPADSLHLSLNRIDEPELSSSPENSLPSLHITSGDLVFFTFDPSGFSIESSSRVEEKQIEQSQSVDSDLEKLRLEDFVPRNCPKSILLSRVMKEKLGHGRKCNAHKLLVIAVHSVLLDSGLFSNDRIDIPEDWRSTQDTVIIRYTLGEPYTMNETAMLKFQSILYSVIVYESIDFRRGSNVYSVTLEEGTFAPNLDSIWANSMSPNKIIDEKEWNIIERKMCELWKVVKDGLVLPMFMVLPNDVMLKIMESLSGVDIGKLQCVCTELCDLGNDKDLWRLKFNQEFPLEADPQNEQWKQKFEECHRNRMNMNMNMEQEQEPPHPDFMHRRGNGVWRIYLQAPRRYLFPQDPGYYHYARVPDQHAFRAFNPHLQLQERGRGQNVLNPHVPWQGYGQWRNVFNPHRGLHGRGRERERGRGRGR